MQLKNPVLAKFDVRLALSRAIDRKTLVKVVYNDVNLPATYWLVKGLPGFQGNKFDSIIGFDATAAKKALSDAGYPGGAGFPALRLTVTDSPTNRALTEFLQKNWKDTLGIDTTIELVDSKTRSQRFNSEDFDLFPGGWQLDYPDPENPIVGLFNTGGGNNHYNCSDPAIDAAITDAAKKTDFASHVVAYQAVEDLVVTKLCGIAPIWQGALPYLVNPKIGGVHANGTIDAGQPGNWCAECWYIKK
jgi:oligopeptide transport system substrate-binding protein